MLTNKNIHRVVALWCSDDNQRIFNKYGDIIDWDTSRVTNMKGLFKGKIITDTRLYWDTSNVTDMSEMFAYSTFNGDIHDWDTSNVKNMDEMFYCARYFNEDISQWNVNRVKSINNMFYGATSFTRNIDNIIDRNLIPFLSYLKYSGFDLMVREQGYEDIGSLFKYRRRENFMMFLVSCGFIMYGGDYMIKNNHPLFDVEDMNYYILKFL